MAPPRPPCVCFSCLRAAPAQAADSGYSFDAATGTLTITDASVLDNIEFNQGDIDLSKMEHLVITADNASIQNFAFRNNALLKSVCVTGENITVGSYAFYKCTNLDTVLLLGEVSSIGGYAFCNCTSLRALEFTGGDGTEIKSLAFRGCTALQSMVYSGLIAPTFAIDCFSQIPEDVVALVPEGFNGEAFDSLQAAKYTLDKTTGTLTITSVPEGVTTINYPSQIGGVTITLAQLADGVSVSVDLKSVEVTVDLPPEPEQIENWNYDKSVALDENNTLSLIFLNPRSKDYVEGLLPESITATVNGESTSFDLTWSSADAYPENPTHEVFEKTYTYVARVPGYSFPEGTAPTITIQLQAEDEDLYKPDTVREITLNGSMPKEEFLAYLPSEIAQIDASGKVTYVPVTWECLSYSYVNSNSTTTIKTGGDYEFEATAKNKGDKLSSNVIYTLRAKQTMIEMRISPNWKVQKATTRSGESEGKITWTDKNGETYNITIDGYEDDFSGNEYIYIDPKNAQKVQSISQGSDKGKHVYRVEVTIEGENAENAEPDLSSTYGYRYVEDYDNKNTVSATSYYPESYLIDAEKGKSTFAIMTVIDSDGIVTFNFGNGFIFRDSTETQHTFTLDGSVGNGRSYTMALVDDSDKNKTETQVSNLGKTFFTVTPPDNDHAWAVMLIPTKKTGERGKQFRRYH